MYAEIVQFRVFWELFRNSISVSRASVSAIGVFKRTLESVELFERQEGTRKFRLVAHSNTKVKFKTEGNEVKNLLFSANRVRD